ncbi:MAG: hypothetical protein KA144_08795 [Xanthomonadaceae bacterium]|nr:hypothetical protein [Xanthomonadaceae bacterium]
MELGKAVAVNSGIPIKPFEELLRRQESLEIWAKEVVNQHHHATNLPALLNIWATIEALVEDTATLIIFHEISARNSLIQAGVKEASVQPSTEDDARKIYERSLQKLKGPSLAKGFISILQCIGVPLQLNSETIDSLQELNYIRNCSLHREGIIELRVKREAPTLNIPLGEKICIDSAKFLKYYDACSDFVQSLIPAMGQTHYQNWSPAS